MSNDRHLRELADSGFCVIEGVIPNEDCSAVRAELEAAVAAHGSRYASSPAMGFVPGIINYVQSFAPFLADERLLALVGCLLGEHVRISFTSAIINRPGSERGEWHADWPFNQRNAGHIPAPYPDAVFHLTTLWMLSRFSEENGGTFVLPGSHRRATNPTAADCGMDPKATLPGEVKVAGSEGSVLVMDSRLWHAVAPNRTHKARVALAVRYAPWWLHTEVLRPGSEERQRMVDETGATDNIVPAVPRSVFERLPERVKPLYRHWVER